MSDNTGIEWTEATWNPVTGCSKVSQGCKHCYAERDWARLSKNPKSTKYYRREFTDVQCHPEALDQPLRWKRPRRIFVNSMSDLFHEDVPFDFIVDVFNVMYKARQHTFQVLTKRPERALEFFHRYGLVPDDFLGVTPSGEVVPPNVWLGVSVEDQADADHRIPLLLQTPAAVRWVSMEPLLGPVSFEGRWVEHTNQALHENWLDVIDWVVVGGESGPKARPMHPYLVRLLRDQCQATQVPFFFKQWGEWSPTHAVRGLDAPGREWHTFDDGQDMWRIGKKKAGRTLDGRTWDEYPEAAK